MPVGQVVDFIHYLRWLFGAIAFPLKVQVAKRAAGVRHWTRGQHQPGCAARVVGFRALDAGLDLLLPGLAQHGLHDRETLRPRLDDLDWRA